MKAKFPKKTMNNTNSDNKVDQGATDGDAETSSLKAAQGDRPSNDGIRSNWIWYNVCESGFRIGSLEPLQIMMGFLGFFVLLSCSTPPYNYSNFKSARPKSILVLPPLSKSTDMKSSLSCLSTITQPLAELGYYVFPVAVVEEFLKNNGMPTPGEMHQISPKKVHDILGADAILYITIEQYGSKYVVVTQNNSAVLKGKLIDARTGLLLWDGSGASVDSQSGSNNNSLAGMLVGAAISQVINSTFDASYQHCQMANGTMLSTPEHGLLYGPRNKHFKSEKF